MSQPTYIATIAALDLVRHVSAWLSLNWRMLGLLFAAAMIGWGVFATWITAIEYTNHAEFCVTCHSMKGTVRRDNTQRTLFGDQAGGHGGCPDCQAPRYRWIAEAETKVGTIGELYAFFLGGISNAGGFERGHPRQANAARVKFQATGAGECHHCHGRGDGFRDPRKSSARVHRAETATAKQNCAACHEDLIHENHEEKPDAPVPAIFDVN